jgi:hypothetical protein
VGNLYTSLGMSDGLGPFGFGSRISHWPCVHRLRSLLEHLIVFTADGRTEGADRETSVLGYSRRTAHNSTSSPPIDMKCR